MATIPDSSDYVLSAPTIIPAQPGWSAVEVIYGSDPSEPQECRYPVIAWAIQVLTHRERHFVADITAPMLHERLGPVIVPITAWGTLPMPELLRTPEGEYQMFDGRFVDFKQAAAAVRSTERAEQGSAA